MPAKKGYAKKKPAAKKKAAPKAKGKMTPQERFKLMIAKKKKAPAKRKK